jgi:hypothetical protein
MNHSQSLAVRLAPDLGPGGHTEERRGDALSRVRRVYVDWLQGGLSSEDALFEIGDALDVPDSKAE